MERQDDEQRASKFCERVLAYRIFSDEHGKMNLMCTSRGASCWSCPNSPWRRIPIGACVRVFPAAPADARRLYDDFTDRCRQTGIHTETGRFGADMQVALFNDGPVTFWLQF